ncbi:hypothetical protein DEH69_10630 [Streptomyces sp. PT12]|nr:hypothetical protein DEH69_10630 [Streptomyces sp. PT12]
MPLNASWKSTYSIITTGASASPSASGSSASLRATSSAGWSEGSGCTDASPSPSAPPPPSASPPESAERPPTASTHTRNAAISAAASRRGAFPRPRAWGRAGSRGFCLGFLVRETGIPPA